MQTRQLGKTGLAVSAIGMGTWELGGQEWGDIDESDAVSLLRYAHDRGITLYDTADQYGGGRSETLLGKAFLQHQRRRRHRHQMWLPDRIGWLAQPRRTEAGIQRHSGVHTGLRGGQPAAVTT